MPRILIVEDNPAHHELIVAVLERDGFEVTSSTRATEAERTLNDQQPDLILMDIDLPGEDGLSLARRLKANPATARIPIVAVSAHALPGDQGVALAAGCDGYISKPIDTRRLSSQLEGFLPRRSAVERSLDHIIRDRERATSIRSKAREIQRKIDATRHSND